MKTLYASVCTLLLISFGCKPEQKVSQSDSPMLSTSTPCWAVWTSLDSTIWDYMQHPAEPDDEYANELMYATAMAIQEASCEEGFLDDYFTSITDTGGIFLPDFLNHYPQWTSIFAYNYATYGFNLTDILTDGFTAYGDEYHITLWSPYSNALYPEGIPAVGIASDMWNDNDSIFDRIPAFIPIENTCNFAEGAVGYAEDYADCEILPYEEQQTFLEFNMIIVSFAQTRTQQLKNTAIETETPTSSTWGPGDPNQCEFGLGLAIREFTMYNRLERNRRSEVWMYNVTSGLGNMSSPWCLNEYFFGASPWTNLDFGYYNVEKIHKNKQGQIVQLNHWLRDPEQFHLGNLSQSATLVNQDMFFVILEKDWAASKKTVLYENPCGSSGNSLQMVFRMKYRGDVFAHGSLDPRPMGEDWCVGTSGVYDQQRGRVKVVTH